VRRPRSDDDPCPPRQHAAAYLCNLYQTYWYRGR
jgi:hypothetical protein